MGLLVVWLTEMDQVAGLPCVVEDASTSRLREHVVNLGRWTWTASPELGINLYLGLTPAT